MADLLGFCLFLTATLSLVATSPAPSSAANEVGPEISERVKMGRSEEGNRLSAGFFSEPNWSKDVMKETTLRTHCATNEPKDIGPSGSSDKVERNNYVTSTKEKQTLRELATQSFAWTSLWTLISLWGSSIIVKGFKRIVFFLLGHRASNGNQSRLNESNDVEQKKEEYEEEEEEEGEEEEEDSLQCDQERTIYLDGLTGQAVGVVITRFVDDTLARAFPSNCEQDRKGLVIL